MQVLRDNAKDGTDDNETTKLIKRQKDTAKQYAAVVGTVEMKVNLESELMGLKN